jgi:hypothetical protein
MNSNKQPSIFRRSEYTNAAMTKRLAKMTSKSTPSSKTEPDHQLYQHNLDKKNQQNLNFFSTCQPLEN